MNKKALSPVVTSIILIAVTVAVSIAVAAWMGTLTIESMNSNQRTLHIEATFPNDYTLSNDMSISLGLWENNPHNILLIYKQNFPEDSAQIKFLKGNDFMYAVIHQTNVTIENVTVTYIFTNFNQDNYDSSMVPANLKSDTSYPLGKFRIWFYLQLPEYLGDAVCVYTGQVNAWYENT